MLRLILMRRLCNGREIQKGERNSNQILDSASDGQVANLAQNLLNPVVQVSTSILISGVGVQVLLNLCHSRIGFCAESQLNLDKGFERRVEVWNA
jgi:hypothetical protein